MADESAKPNNFLIAEAPAKPVILLELFTSQGCYSCPPAEALVRDIYAGRQDVVPLEFHVDYWNDLIYGLAGSWEDPFSSPDYTARQVAYNLKLRRTRGVYTPQMVVQGRHQGSGARQGRIEAFIETEAARESPLSFYFDGAAENGLTARLEGNLNGSEDFYYAVYWLKKTTEIPSGENKGKTLASRNIVKEIGRRDATRRRLSLPPVNTKTEGCVVWAQRQQTGAVLAAARCPGVEVAGG